MVRLLALAPAQLCVQSQHLGLGLGPAAPRVLLLGEPFREVLALPGGQRQHVADPPADQLLDLLAGLGGVEHEIAGGLGARQLEEAGPDPLVEVRGQRLEAVLPAPRGVARAPDPGELLRDVEQHREVGHETVGRPSRQLGDLVGVEVAARALVGDATSPRTGR